MTRLDAPATETRVEVAAPAGRLDGLDLARALAFTGMLFAHFAFAYSLDDPGWLQALDNVADGRAAPLFCVLLGVGAGILTRRGTPDRVVVQRGVALFVLGIAIWPYVSDVYLILPHYGLLLVLVPLLRRLPTGALLPAAGLAFLVPSTITAVMNDHGMRAAAQPDSYAALFRGTDLLEQLLWTGGYPLVGWVGFALVGLWMARQPLHDRSTQLRFVVGGALVAALQPLAALAFHALDGVNKDPDARGWSSFLDGAAHSNATAWYVFASASAVAAVGACLLVAHVFRTALRPLYRLGAMALTAYLLHLLVGGLLVWDWRDREFPPLTTQLLVIVVVFAALLFAADVWGRRWRRAPVEAVLRAISG